VLAQSDPGKALLPERLEPMSEHLDQALEQQSDLGKALPSLV